MLNTGGNLFAGGGPDLADLTAGRWQQGFHGCIHALTLNGRDVDFKLDAVVTANLLPCTSG